MGPTRGRPSLLIRRIRSRWRVGSRRVCDFQPHRHSDIRRLRSHDTVSQYSIISDTLWCTPIPIHTLTLVASMWYKDDAYRWFDVSYPGRTFTNIPTCHTRKALLGQKGLISCLSFNPDLSGSYAAGSYDKSICVYVEDMQGAALELSALGFGVTHMKVDKNGVIFSTRCFVHTCINVCKCLLCIYHQLLWWSLLSEWVVVAVRSVSMGGWPSQQRAILLGPQTDPRKSWHCGERSTGSNYGYVCNRSTLLRLICVSILV